MKKFNSKLSLKKSTVANLNPDEMKEAKGGIWTLVTSLIYDCYSTGCGPIEQTENGWSEDVCTVP
jgi:hypothetical protein